LQAEFITVIFLQAKWSLVKSTGWQIRSLSPWQQQVCCKITFDSTIILSDKILFIARAIVGDYMFIGAHAVLNIS
jgi:hypothetical protein